MSIKKKLSVLGVLIVVLVAGGVTVSLYSMNQLVQLKDGQRLLTEVERDVLLLQSLEPSVLIQGQTASEETFDARYLGLLESVESLTRLLNSFEIESDELVSFRQSLSHYQSSFEQFVAAINVVSGKDQGGFYDRLRKVSVNIELLTNIHGNPEWLALIAQLRQTEKRFLLSAQETHLTEFETLIVTFQNGVEASTLLPDAKQQLAFFIGQYQNDFREMVAAYSESGFSLEKDFIGDIQTASSEVVVALSSLQSVLWVELDKTLSSLMFMLLGVTLSLGLAALFMLFSIRKQFTTGTTGLTRFVREVIETGSLSKRFKHQHNDEIHELAICMNALLLNVQKVVLKTNAAVNSLSKGDFSRRVDVEAFGDLALLKKEVNASVDSVAKVVKELTKLTSNVKRGKWSKFRTKAHYEGGFDDILQNTNQAISELQDFHQELTSVMNQLHQGGKNLRIEADAQGELLTLKNSINTSLRAIEVALAGKRKKLVA